MPKTVREECLRIYVIIATLNFFWIIALIWAIMDENRFAEFLAGVSVVSHTMILILASSDMFGSRSREVEIDFKFPKETAEEILKAGRYYGSKDLKDSVILAIALMKNMVQEQTERGRVIMLFDKENPEKSAIFGSALTDKDIYDGLGLNDKD